MKNVCSLIMSRTYVYITLCKPGSLFADTCTVLSYVPFRKIIVPFLEVVPYNKEDMKPKMYTINRLKKNVNDAALLSFVRAV